MHLELCNSEQTDERVFRYCLLKEICGCLRILLVGDDEAVRLLAEVLEPNGFRVVRVPGVKCALGRLSTEGVAEHLTHGYTGNMAVRRGGDPRADIGDSQLKHSGVRRQLLPIVSKSDLFR